MQIVCPHCGQVITDGRFGRKRLNLNVNDVLDKYQACGSITQTAKKFGCSRGHIYNVIKSFPGDKEHDTAIQNNEAISG
jgi:DNA invertase Pin-like site-specific DNA recombinase